MGFHGLDGLNDLIEVLLLLGLELLSGIVDDDLHHSHKFVEEEIDVLLLLPLDLGDDAVIIVNNLDIFFVSLNLLHDQFMLVIFIS